MARSDLELKVLICFVYARKICHMQVAGRICRLIGPYELYAAVPRPFGKKLENVSSCGKILKILNSQNFLKIPAAPAAQGRMTNNGNSANACSRKLFTKKFLKHLTKLKFWPGATVKGQSNCQTILTNA